ncbi:MAG: hypothetical protein HN975_12240 [Anaerolineae bacterium]|jgi:hypothetical protein|nr:hypothetical protein [Anaerolineae bacterium]
MIKIIRPSQRPAGGRAPSSAGAMTRQQTQYETDAVLHRGLSSMAWRTLDLLYAGGIMTVDQIGLTQRTLRRYAKRRLIARYPYPPKEVIQQLEERFIAVEDGQLYTLGQVGMEILATRHGARPSQVYLAYPFERILRALVLNEIVRKIAAEAEWHGWLLTRYSREQAQLIKDEKAIFFPDALICLERGEQEVLFLIEYHDEENRREAHQNVDQYETAWESGLWEEAWLGENFPLVLTVFQHDVVGEGYREAIAEMRAVNCSFYGRSLNGIWLAGGMDVWVNINKGNREKVFPWQE